MKLSAGLTHGRVLIVGSNEFLPSVVRRTLAEISFEVATASTCKEALTCLRQLDYDLVLLDADLPGLCCADSCWSVRNESSSVWIGVLSVRDCVEERIQALDAGADLYVHHPFHGRELAARIRAVARRLRLAANKSIKPIHVGDFCLDPARRVVVKDAREIRLTTTQFHLLYQLMASAGQPVQHSVLLDVLWGKHTDKERGYLRIYISQLRNKLEVQPTQPRVLLTYPNVGYLFANPKPMP